MMNVVVRLGSSIVPRMLAIVFVGLMLQVGLAVAHDQGLNIPGSGWLVPAIARADTHGGDGDEDDNPEGTEDGDEDGDDNPEETGDGDEDGDDNPEETGDGDEDGDGNPEETGDGDGDGDGSEDDVSEDDISEDETGDNN